MNKKRVALFINSLEHGGAQKIASVLIKELSVEFDLFLVLLKDEIVYEIPKETSISVLGDGKNSGILNKIRNIRKYAKFCKQKKIDVSLSLLTQPNYISVLSKYAGNKSKIILSEHTYQSLWRSNEVLYSKVKRTILNVLYNRADKIITVSKKIQEDLNKNFGVNEKKLLTIYNPYMIDKLIKMSKEEVQDVDYNGKFTFVTVGTLYHVKNQELLIRSFSRLMRDDIQLLIVGDGELRTELENLCRKLNVTDKVKFIGFTKNPFKYVSKSDVFVLSSNNEGLPNVIIEALSCGCPVVSTDCISGPREILAPETSLSLHLKNEIEEAEHGLLVPVRNEELMAAAFLRMMEEEKLYNSYKKGAQQRALFFDANNSIKHYVNTIHSV